MCSDRLPYTQVETGRRKVTAEMLTDAPPGDQGVRAGTRLGDCASRYDNIRRAPHLWGRPLQPHNPRLLIRNTSDKPLSRDILSMCPAALKIVTVLKSKGCRSPEEPKKM